MCNSTFDSRKMRKQRWEKHPQHQHIIFIITMKKTQHIVQEDELWRQTTILIPALLQGVNTRQVTSSPWASVT